MINTKSILLRSNIFLLSLNQVILDENLPKDLQVNEALFCTAIDNLIRNGLKYNDAPTKWVKIYSEGDFICIQDNGRGLTPKEFWEFSKPYARKEGQKEQEGQEEEEAEEDEGRCRRRGKLRRHHRQVGVVDVVVASSQEKEEQEVEGKF